jgi:hypothetical protein
LDALYIEREARIQAITQASPLGEDAKRNVLRVFRREP